MKTLSIVRHAYAGQHGDPRFPDDSLRPLTPAGVKQFRKAMKRLVERGFKPQLIATSPLVRCRQTAELIYEQLDSDPLVVELEALAPGSDLEALLEWSQAQQADWIAWVGHAPDVDQLTTRLLGAPSQTLSFRKGAVATLRFEDSIQPQAAQLRYFLAPSDLGAKRRE